MASISEAKAGSGPQALTEGVVVNTIFTSTGYGAGSRTPMELLELLRALQADISSALHASDFFRYIFRDYALNAIYVSLCPDNIYRSIQSLKQGLVPAVE